MMKLLNFSRSVKAEGVAPKGLERTVLERTTASTGFPFGAVLDLGRSQATIAVGVGEDGVVPDSTWRKFEAAVVHMAGLVSTVTVDETCRGRQRSRAAVTVRAQAKEQRKDVTEMMTALAQSASTLHTAAEVSGIDATLMVADELLETAASAWELEEVPENASWPQFGVSPVEESPTTLTVGQRRSITWEIDLGDPAVADEVAEAISVIQFGPTVLRWTRVFRPVAVADAFDATDTTGDGRRSGILTVVVDGSDTEHLEDVGGQILSVLSARTRLRVRRAVGRQQLMAVAGLGTGVLGWQNLEVSR